MTNRDHSIAVHMATHGGGFVKLLGQAALVADENNLEKIKATWSDYWIKHALRVDQVAIERKREIASVEEAWGGPVG